MTGSSLKDIIGVKGDELKNKKIVLCITGSIAALHSPEVAHELMRYGANIFAAMSPMSQKIIHPYAMEWATGNPVVTEITGQTENIQLVGEHPEKADLVLVAPATDNTISKIAGGINDTSVTAMALTALGSHIPLLVCPAMHKSMYSNAIIAENVKRLKTLGIDFIEPRSEEGKAKIASTEEIVDNVIQKLTSKKMNGLYVLVTAGSTCEHIDPLRIITNKSSGKMGIAIAREALRRGAEVTLIYGSGIAQAPPNAKVIRVDKTEDMHTAVTSELKSKKYDILVATAAVADYTPQQKYDYKLGTSSAPELKLTLKPTAKIIDEVKKISSKTFLIAFKAEFNLPDGKLVKNAYNCLKRSHADLVVVNDVGKKDRGFNVDTNEVFVIDSDQNKVKIPLSSKNDIAKKIFDLTLKKLN
ncbi:MAG: bifunctional phosphopantothenoylcysteine decarboxylase/phosphopantothenate--cysteine ligase CoaBC [Candidatus Bathyarchaeota archaeon]